MAAATSIALLQALAEQHSTPTNLYLSLPAENRDPLLLPHLINVLDDFINLLKHAVRGHVPHNIYRNHIQATVGLLDRLTAYQRSLSAHRTLHTPVSRTIAATGRLRIDLTVDMLLDLQALGYTDAEVADDLGISRRTVTRRRAQLGMNKRLLKHSYTQQSLEQVSLRLTPKITPGVAKSTVQLVFSLLATVSDENTGQKMMYGLIRAQNVLVTRQQIRDIMRARDPHGTMLRKAQVLSRREYEVPFINSVWHMDGQHKLINWKFVIHGAVDGKSRLITFMQVADNNRAETVDEGFISATKRWGWPSRVRADFGGENLGVRAMMMAVRGK
jgi:AraC-like DNA-binding protein